MELQAEFDTLQRRGWLVQPYAAALLSRLRTHCSTHGTCEVLDLLSSLIVTVRGELEETGETPACSRPVEDWVRAWWRRVETEIPQTSTSAGSSAPIEVLDTQVEEGERLALEELEYQREREAELAARRAQEEEHDEEERTWESEMERISEMYARAGSAARHQEWEDWVLDQEMHRPPPRTRRYVEVDVGPAPGAARVDKKLKMAVPLDCGPQVVLRNAQLVQSDNASTCSAPSTVLAPPVDSQPVDQQRVTSDALGGQGVPRELDFGNCMTQYSRLQQGIISPEYVRQMWGENTLDLMLAQADVEQLEASEGASTGLGMAEPVIEGLETPQGTSVVGQDEGFSTAETVVESISREVDDELDPDRS